MLVKVLVKVLVEVAEVRACKASCHFSPSAFRILPGGGATGGGGGGPYMQGFVSYVPPPPFEFLQGEADRDAGAGAEGIENVTSTGNS